MSALDDFLSLPDVSDITEDITIKLGKKVMTLTIRAMNAEEHKEYQDKGKLSANRSGKISFDIAKYNSAVVVGQVLEPNFNNADFLKKAGYNTASEFISAKFPAGVIAEIAEQVTKLSGFDAIDKDVEEAKN